MEKIKSKECDALNIKEEDSFVKIEDNNDLSQLEQIVTQGTRTAFKKANKVAKEMVFAKNGELVRKKSGEAYTVISKLEERQVKIGQKTSL